MPVLIRRTGAPVTTSDTRRAARLGALALAVDLSPVVAGAGVSSTTVENSLHLGQRPYQRPDVAPQAWQRKTAETRATGQRARGRIRTVTR
jgi:hypothetical protein